MKELNKFLLFAFVTIWVAACTAPQASQSKRIERGRLFDFSWKFELDSLIDASAENYNDAAWRELDLPHDWSIEGEMKPSNPMGNDGGYFPSGIGWYRKTFRVPEAWEGQLVSIYFEGVYMNAEVFVNGQSLGIHPYGYTSFFHDLTPYLKYGQNNVIAVKVDNSIQKNCRWYSGSGIYRHVWLNVTDSLHLDEWGLAITTPEVKNDKAKVKVQTQVVNESTEKRTFTLRTQIFDKGGKGVTKKETQLVLDENSKQVIAQDLIITGPQPWSPESPHLYSANIAILEDGMVIDELTETFGVRTIEFNAENGFLLNGRPMLLNGGCVHHDNGCLGAKAYDRAEERKVELLKEAGFNAVRTSHNPPSEAFLEACDRLGLLVVDESFDGWRTSKAPQAPMDYSLHFDEWWQRDIEAMVLRDRNHPSIIMWSIGNEIMERTEPQAVKIAHMLATHVRNLDPTRPVTSAMTTWGQGWEVFDSLMAQHDIGGYNYQLFRAEEDHERVPERVIVNTESYPRNAFFIWNLVQKHDYIIGDFVWTAMDYLGESSIGRYYYPGEPDGQHWERDFYPWHGAYCGDIDLIGWRKPISHYRSMLYNSDEKLYMAVREPNPKNGEIKLTDWAVWPTWERWNWEGYEGQPIQIEVYSKYPKVQLFLNDELVGEKSTTIKEEFKAIFDVPYREGELKVIGIQGEDKMEYKILNTAGEATQIHLNADRTELAANGQDLSYVMIEIADEKGILSADANIVLDFAIEGPGEIVGVDNANLKDLGNYTSLSRKTWNGRAMVVVKSTRQPGEIILTVTGEDVQSVEIQLISNSTVDKELQ